MGLIIMIMIIWISVIAINVVIILSLISSSSCSKSQQTQPSIFPKPSRLCSCLHIVGTIFALAYISGCFVIVQYDLISWYFIMIITIIIINMKKNISPHLLLSKSHHAELVKRPKYTFLLPPLAILKELFFLAEFLSSNPPVILKRVIFYPEIFIKFFSSNPPVILKKGYFLS